MRTYTITSITDADIDESGDMIIDVDTDAGTPDSSVETVRLMAGWCYVYDCIESVSLISGSTEAAHAVAEWLEKSCRANRAIKAHLSLRDELHGDHP